MTTQSICGKAVYFDKYIGDGPGYTGRVLVAVCGQQAHLVQRDTCDPQGNPLLLQVQLEAMLPAVDSVLPLEADDLQQIYRNLSQNSLYYVETPAMLEPDKCAKVRWSDGSTGAILLWGEALFVSAVFFDGRHKGEHFFSFEEARDEFVSPADLLQNLATTADKLEAARQRLTAPGKWIIHPSYGFIEAVKLSAYQAGELKA